MLPSFPFHASFTARSASIASRSFVMRSPGHNVSQRRPHSSRVRGRGRYFFLYVYVFALRKGLFSKTLLFRASEM